ncbi:hypothetical protein Tco_1131907 [Tanacetum coccineum]|uniref:Uncharacterized protein n=1 Tax=Tanacetum coccineum TaxID=301880 RepID=A0ABQ5JB18_9ASTR
MEPQNKDVIKSLTKLLASKYQEQPFLKAINENTPSPRRVYFVNTITLVKKERESRDDTLSEHEGLTSRVDNKVRDYELEEEEVDDLEYFNTFPSMKELEYHEWLLKNPRPPWEDDEKITFKMPHRMEMFKNIDIKDMNTDPIPPFVLDNKNENGKVYYSNSLIIGPEYKQDESVSKEIQHLLKLEREARIKKGGVTFTTSSALQAQNELFREENGKVKQHYKELYDSIKITRAKTIEKTSSLLNEIESQKAQLKEKMNCITMDYVKSKVLSPGMYVIDVEPIPPHNRNYREVHKGYLKRLKEVLDTLREIVKEARFKKPEYNVLKYACLYTKKISRIVSVTFALFAF